jgi:hypothetical protein
MINFLLWTMPLLGISFPIVIGLSILLIIAAFLINNDKLGAWIVSFVVIMLLIWGIWIGLYHVYPVIQAHNNLLK